MQTPLERAQGRTLKEISPVLARCYSYSQRNVSDHHMQWMRQRFVTEYSKSDPDRAVECHELIDWALGSPQDLEVFMARRSPGTAAKWAVAHSRRLCEEAEKIIKEKAGDRSTLLDYCSHFGILLDDVSKITMKAAFGEDSLREKAYIKKMEHTKKKLKDFLVQMVKIGQVDPNLSVQELMEVL